MLSKKEWGDFEQDDVISTWIKCEEQVAGARAPHEFAVKVKNMLVLHHESRFFKWSVQLFFNKNNFRATYYIHN